ncbi:hypothetical protein MSAS_02690 [Mycobacterium saskatchewanense]|nr:hypothetical protein MSAS_02690 [Mycobacterium saskatchewanense]
MPAARSATMSARAVGVESRGGRAIRLADPDARAQPQHRGRQARQGGEPRHRKQPDSSGAVDDRERRHRGGHRRQEGDPANPNAGCSAPAKFRVAELAQPRLDK